MVADRNAAALAPAFSVVIPTHARPLELRACLEGIAGLDYDLGRIEVIVVDDGGRDPLDALLAEFEGRIALRVVAQPRGGPAAARNAGAAIARGTWLAFIDDDCVPDRGWLRAFEHMLLANDGRLLGGRVENGLADNAYADASERISHFVYENSRLNGAREHFFTTNNIALRADRFRELDGFTRAIPSETAEDKEFCDRWRARGWTLSHAPDALVRHRHYLTLRQFLRQHYNYGRGILAFRLLRRGPGQLVPERSSFYLDLVTSPLRDQQAKRPVRATVLIAAAQMATLTGAIAQAIRWPADRPGSGTSGPA
jgi:glycosyltransferase involved in cell wall biosynthesis